MQDIKRLGLWNLGVHQAHYLLTGLKPAILLTMGFYQAAAQGEFGVYWRESFMVLVQQELIAYLAPWFYSWNAKVDAAAAAKQPLHPSVLGFQRLVPYLMVVVVQDALELAEAYPDNPVHVHLLKHPLFR
jgi:hypothetical protein